MAAETPWVDGLTFGQVLQRTVAEYGARDAVVFPQLSLRWSFEEFDAEVQRVAKGLMGLRVSKGDHVGIWATNWPEWILAQFATAMIGAVLVNVNPAYRSHELAYILKQADIRVLLIQDTHKTSNYEEMVAAVVPETTSEAGADKIANMEYPFLKHVVSIRQESSLAGVLAWPTFLAGGADVPDERLAAMREDVEPQDPVNIQYTSGTTGDPKGATLSHRNLLMNAFYCGERQHFTPDDRLCIPVPFYHCFGCVMGTLGCVVHGATMVIPAESFEPEATLSAIEKEKCTALYGVPTMFSGEVNSPEFKNYDLTSLRTGIMAGSPCPVELMKQVTQDMHLTEMTIAFGQTEASPIITHSETTDSMEVRVSTVGSVIPGIEVRIVDPDSGKDVAVGEQGELLSRGHGVMLGYYKMPEATAAAIDPEGWLHTGDLATETPEGNYRITGRIKDMIIRGGENVYPRELEEFLMTHDKVREVQVVGVPDEKFVEAVSAWIVPTEPGAVSAEEIQAFCKDQIAHYKVPRYVEFLDEFPLTVTGKVQKFKLRDMGIEKFGLEKAAGVETA